jgi:6-phosphogluconate dehydrogenase
MQLGMVGLARMGANMVRRRLRGGHACVAFVLYPEPVEQPVAEGATGARSLEELVGELEPPQSVWLMVPAAPGGDSVISRSGDTAVEDWAGGGAWEVSCACA